MVVDLHKGSYMGLGWLGDLHTYITNEAEEAD